MRTIFTDKEKARKRYLTKMTSGKNFINIPYYVGSINSIFSISKRPMKLSKDHFHRQIEYTARKVWDVLYDMVLDRAAVSVEHQKWSKDPGGIDLNPAQMSMQVKNQGEDFKFDFNGTEIDAAQVTGATFTIRTMTPVTDLPIELGLTGPLKQGALAA